MMTESTADMSLPDSDEPETKKKKPDEKQQSLAQCHVTN